MKDASREKYTARGKKNTDRYDNIKHSTDSRQNDRMQANLSE
jgi:hypothetical protein